MTPAVKAAPTAATPIHEKLEEERLELEVRLAAALARLSDRNSDVTITITDKLRCVRYCLNFKDKKTPQVELAET
jgi:hypothetical protein